MDILFGIDASGSVGTANFQYTLDWLQEIVSKDVSINSRMGFTVFSFAIDEQKKLQFWPNEDDLIDYIDNIYYPRGVTSTGPLIIASIEQFKEYFESDRQRLFVIITDGTPLAGARLEYSVCEFKGALQFGEIQTAMIGVGDKIETEYVACVADYYFEIDSYSDLDLLSGDGYQLSDILCPADSLPDVYNDTNNGTRGFSFFLFFLDGFMCILALIL